MCVSKDAHSDTRMHLTVGKQRAARAPTLMHGDLPNSGLSAGGHTNSERQPGRASTVCGRAPTLSQPFSGLRYARQSAYGRHYVIGYADS
jgi:hypothetical protein